MNVALQKIALSACLIALTPAIGARDHDGICSDRDYRPSSNQMVGGECAAQDCDINGDFKFFDDCVNVALMARSNLISEPAIPLYHNLKRIDCGNTPGPDLFDAIEIFDHVPAGTCAFPQTWVDLISITYFRSTYQTNNRETGCGAQFGTSVVGSASYRKAKRTSCEFRFLPTVTKADVFTDGIDRQDRILISLRGNFGTEATIVSTRTYPEPNFEISETTTSLNIEFQADQEIELCPSRQGSDTFRFLTVSSMFSSSTVYDANLLRWEDPNGEVHSFRLTDETPRPAHLLPANTELGCWLELVKETTSSWNPDSPSIRVEVAECDQVPYQLGIQGYLAEACDSNADSLNVWVEWRDVPKPILKGTVATLQLTITASPPESVPGACPADLDGNGEVRVPDLIILLGAWGPNPCHPADLNGDEEVRVPDLIILLGSWGPCQ